MRKPALLPTLTLSSAVLLSGAALAQPTPEQATERQQQLLSEQCLAMQFLGGRSAYRECLNGLLETTASDDRPVLDFNERYAVAAACSDASDRDSCIAEQQDALLAAPRVNLAPLDSEAAQAIEQRCLDSIGSNAAGYRECLAAAMADDGRPAAAGAGEPAEEAPAEQTAAVADRQDPEDDSRTAAPSSAVDTGRAQDPTGNDPAGSIDEQDTPVGSDAGDDGARSPVYLETVEDFDVRSPLERLSDALDGFRPYGGLVVAALVAVGGLGLALLLYLLLRRRDSTPASGSVAAQAPVDRHRRRRRTASPASHTDDDLFDSLDRSLDELPEPTAPGRRDRRARDRQPTAPDPLELARIDRRRPHIDLGDVDESAVTRLANDPLATPSSETSDTDTTATTTDDADRSVRSGTTTRADTAAADSTLATGTFDDWLGNQPAAQRRAICSEFLVYWTAYADERYDPALVRRLASADDANTMERIKRWALDGDPATFAAAVAWLSQHGTRLQLEQTLSLIMALLVTERAISPVQTVLLRLLADAFGIGNEALEAEFEDSFGHPLPPMPRPDRLSWWKRQASLDIQRQAVTGSEADAGTDSRSRQLLGLDHPARDIDVIRAYRRAARRCHPDRFSALGSRERGMAVRQFDRFEQARDQMLGVLA